MNPCEDKRIEQMVLYAWVGEEDFPGAMNTDVGIKSAIVPAGCIPMVSCKHGQLDRLGIAEQMRVQVNRSGKTRRLVRFVYDSVEMEIAPTV